ncbi:hypothetical protein ASC75_23805 [Aminobacter sp. DSM 101952]|uniref:hypothetical protein n=1 Tax=Aminobacter sp. DSM 101952 TaxID=2735891 RepID=UPI0006F539AB|nr:hypothetical protein [Aminobacter sp. DSM 101952]KQU72413.1 hypothetical protein ASC75_23805 [Aminobacter sp. DSM 101952]
MGPFIRIALRYGVGGLIGYQLAEQLAGDPVVVAVVTVAAIAAVGFVTEGFYMLARKLGWRT